MPFSDMKAKEEFGAPSDEWETILRAILSEKHAHGTDSEVAAHVRRYAEAHPGHVNLPNQDGWTLLYAAVWRNKPRTLLSLLVHGADAMTRVPTSERTAYETAHMEGRHLCAKILRMAPEELRKWSASGSLPSHGGEHLVEDKEKGKKKPSKRSQGMSRLLVRADEVEKQVARVFVKHDTDGSGAISTAELAGCFREIGCELSAEEVKGLALRFDADNSGTIDRSEFLTMVHEAKLGAKLFERGVRDVFKKYDKDGSGSIDVAELAQAFKDLYLDIEPDEVESLLLQFDADGSGALDADEFVSLATEARDGTMQTAEDDVLAGGAWSEEEHALYLRAIRQHGEDWRKVAPLVRTRSPVQCRAHHMLIKKRVESGVSANADANADALADAIQRGREKDVAGRAAEASKAAKDAESRRQTDSHARSAGRLEAVHDAVRRAQVRVWREVFPPVKVASWGLMKMPDQQEEELREEEGLRYYIREFKAAGKHGGKAVTVDARMKLRKAWKRDQKAYYASANAKAFRAALDKEVTAKSFAELSLWTAPPAVPGGVCGDLTQKELGAVLRQYGGPWAPFERLAIGSKDPWGDAWAPGLMEHDLTPFRISDVDGGATDMGFGEGKDDDDNDGSAAASDGDAGDEMEQRKRAAAMARSKAR